MLYRSFALATCFALFNMSVPYGAVVTLGIPLEQGIADALKKHGPAPHSVKSHAMTLDELQKTMGKTGECPYIAGQNKWDVIYRGVNLLSGNYSTSVTDMSFDGGYGIPVNVTRSYSANDGSDEPFGKGWSLSADVRSTAGGILKSPGAPVRSVPVAMQERNTAERDPNVATQPAAAITATDAAGKEETVQKDVDGILTTPPWDNNVSNPTYGWLMLGSSYYQVQTGNQTTTPDGTVYTYAAEGYYTNGTKPWNNSQATAQAANVLKVTKVTDRQGNVTLYNYGTTTVTFNKMDGQTTEYPLTSVVMPNGHTITFTWGNGTNAPTNKIVTISDGTRTVSYGYVNDGAGNYLLHTVNVASNYLSGGKTTTYGYGAAGVPQGWQGDDAIDLLTSITSPQGLTTTIGYLMGYVYVAPYNVSPGEGVTVSQVTQPNGVYTTYAFGGSNGAGCIFGDYNPQHQYLGHGQVLTANGSQYTVSMIVPGIVNPDDIMGRFAPYWSKTYDNNAQTLLQDIEYSYNPVNDGPLASSTHRLQGYGPTANTSVTTVSVYNFNGQPLSKTVTEHTNAMSGYTAPSDFTYATSYAYWDSTKYYQQKGTLDPGGRYSYTDYYPNTAPAGSRGQQYEVFDNAHAGFHQNHNIPIPSYMQGDTGDYWKYQLTPMPGQYTAQFAYDSVGRCTDVYKLQSTTSNPWKYVHTQTSYGGNGSPTWGQATQVVEDVGGINRTTQTLAYTAWGKPSKLQDAAGHQFSTAFDLDGTIQSVTRVDSGLNQTIVSYSYGTTSGVTYGQPIAISDGLSGVSDSITYDSTSTDGGYGQVSEVLESGGPDAAYRADYTYDSSGRRQTVTYTTNKGTQMWGYYDYVRLGSPESGKWGFQTLNQLNASNGARTSEEMHYAFDSQGKLYCGAFCQTPASGQVGYDTDPAAYRCRFFYGYDPSGRTLSATHWWESWNGSSYGEEAVLDNECSYEVNTGLNRGVKLSSAFYKNTAQGSSAWTAVNSESFSYDPNLDYLTGANYGDGLPNATPSWSYDAAGNRTDSVCDNLNRTTSIGGVTTTCDIQGNRQTQGSSSFSYDCLNRMTSNSTGYNYTYRADGMRVDKNNPTTTNGVAFRYDGQSTFEDYAYAGANATQINDYGLGPRGVDYIARTSSAQTTVGFPIYDAHGNMTACLFRTNQTQPTQNTYYSIGNQREYDAWGIIRSGATTQDPRGRYCANLGHKQDDETLFVYMKARYYDPYSGRFVSQDRSRHGFNWFDYCSNDPVNRADSSGSMDFWAWVGVIALVGDVILILACALIEAPAWLIILAIVLTVVVCIDAKHTVESIVDIWKKKLLNPEFKDIQNEQREDEKMLQTIDAMKTEGGFLDKIVACDLELMLYTADAMNS